MATSAGKRPCWCHCRFRQENECLCLPGIQHDDQLKISTNDRRRSEHLSDDLSDLVESEEKDGGLAENIVSRELGSRLNSGCSLLTPSKLAVGSCSWPLAGTRFTHLRLHRPHRDPRCPLQKQANQADRLLQVLISSLHIFFSLLVSASLESILSC
ncbi:hypothetical protein VTN96DRAFT_5936 [Rasamsonia emersonii]